MRRLGESSKGTFDIGLGSTSDDNLEPWGPCSRVYQSLQDAWATLSVATFIQCVDDENEGTLGDMVKFADEVDEERVLHRIWCHVWVVTKAFCDNAPKRREDYGEFANESRKDISGLAQI